MNGSSPMRRCALVCLAAAVFAVAGCGGGKLVKVKGKLVLPPKVQLEEKDSLQVSFTSIAAGDKPLNTAANVDHSALTFTINGPEGKGVPPGKYQVDVTCTPYAGEPKAMERKKTLDALFAPFNGGKSQLTVELSGDAEQTVTVDLEKKNVGK